MSVDDNNNNNNNNIVMTSSSSSSSSFSSPLKPQKQPLLSTPNRWPPKSPSPISTQTPEKYPSSAAPPPRLRNRRVALSLTEIRKTASQGSSGKRTSARRQIDSWLDEELKPIASNRRKKPSSDDQPKLPTQYEMLAEFFDSLENSIRLLRLKGSVSSFSNLCPKIQSLTDRRFSHQNLAQLKYVMPELIEIKKVLAFDERTSCMKPDLHVLFNDSAIEFDGKLKAESKTLFLRKLFRRRLADFYKDHPEGDEIPTEILPEPFNHSKQDVSSEATGASISSSPAMTEACTGRIETETLEKLQPAVASHLSLSFQKRFSQKAKSNAGFNNHQNSSKTVFQQSAFPVPEQCLNKISSSEGSSSCASLASVPMSKLCATLTKKIDPIDIREDCPTKTNCFQSTPANLASTPAKLMSATPALHPPKRCYVSPEDDSASSPNKLVRRPPRSRSLKFDTPVKNVDNELTDTEEFSVDDDDDDSLSILPESLLQSIREKERKATEERDPAISQAKRRQQMIGRLPRLFNMIHFMFQSIKQSVITKEELVYKIVANHSYIVDRGEVEEQLQLLLELAPEWISEKVTSSGDLLFRINKMSSAETIRSRLESAK